MEAALRSPFFLKGVSGAALLALALLDTCGVSAQQPQKPGEGALALESYVAELEHWSAVAGRLHEHPEAAGELRRQLPLAWRVAVEGQKFEVPTGWLDAALKSIEQKKPGTEAAGQWIQNRLEAMREQSALLANPRAIEPETARRKLDEILQRREFRDVHRSTWWDRLRERVGRWLENLMEAMLGRFRGHPRIARGFLWAVVLALVAVTLGWMLRLLLERPLRRPPATSAGAPPASAWQELAHEAREAARHGNYRDSIRLGYWAGVYRLEQAGAWEVDRARTPREYLRLLPESHPQHPALFAITGLFERIWYGGQAASSDHFQVVWARLEELGCLLPSNVATAGS